MNVQRSLLRELLLYEFEMGHNAAEETQNICFVENKGPSHLSTVHQIISGDFQASAPSHWGKSGEYHSMSIRRA